MQSDRFDWIGASSPGEGRGVKFAINPDAHSVEGLSHTFSAWASRGRAGWTREDVVKTSSREEVREFFKNRPIHAVPKKSGMLALTTVAKKSDPPGSPRHSSVKAWQPAVNVLSPVESHYTWKGKIHRTREWILLMKKTAGPIRSRIEAERIHPYEWPGIHRVGIARMRNPMPSGC